MKKLLLLLIAYGTLMLQASENVYSLLTSVENVHTIAHSKQQGTPWCMPVPCWQETCQSSYPECCLSKYNRSQERNFRELFYEGGPWDKPDNPIKSCCVEYMHNTSSCNCTMCTAVPAGFLAALLFGAPICGLVLGISQGFCGCPDTNICAELSSHVWCPFGYDPSVPICCGPNSRNIFAILAELACIATPFACFGIECCCIKYLANPENWSKSATSTLPQLVINEDEDDDELQSFK